MNSAKTITFRAQDVECARRVCHTKAETNEAIEWTEELRAEGRLLDRSIATNRYGPDIVEATWIAGTADG